MMITKNRPAKLSVYPPRTSLRRFCEFPRFGVSQNQLVTYDQIPEGFDFHPGHHFFNIFRNTSCLRTTTQLHLPFTERGEADCFAGWIENLSRAEK